MWNRTNHWDDNSPGGGFKRNGPPDGWVIEDGPVWWWGSDSSTAYRADHWAAGYSAITRATNLICNRLAASDWTVGGGSPRWLADPMLTRPDERYPGDMWPQALRLQRTIFWGQWIRSAVSWGMGWLIFVPDANGTPQPGTMKLLHPAEVECGSDPWTGDGWTRRIGRDRWGGRGVEVDRDGYFTTESTRFRLVELRNPTTPTDPTTGCTPGTLAFHAAELGLLPAITEYTAGTYTGAGVPSGYLKVDAPHITQQQADALKSAWQSAHGTGRRSTAVLNATTSYQPIAASPVDTAVADMKKLSLLDVANAYGVPPYLLGAPSGNSATYSNAGMEAAALWTHTLYVWAAAIRDTLGALLPGDQALTIDDPLTAAVDTAVNQATQEVVPDDGPTG
jgi:HK97 family phage portal protein